MNSLDLDNYFRKIVRISFYLLFIIVPLAFTPWNFELFEFNKMVAVYLLTIIITGAWLGRMILQKKILFQKTPLDIPLILFLASQLASTLFSMDRHTSIWGYYSRFHGGLLSTICYLLLYWSFVANTDKRSSLKTIYCSLITAFFVSLYGIAEHFGIDARFWVQDVRTRVFSSLGQPNWLAAYLAILIPLPISLFLNCKFVINNWKLYLYSCLYLLLSLCFLYTRSQSGVLGIGVALIIYWLILFVLNTKQKFTEKKMLFLWGVIFNLSFLILFILVGVSSFPQISNFLKRISLFQTATQTQTAKDVVTPVSLPAPDASSPTGEIRKIVWKGAMEIWKHYPIFGSGVETFAYTYYNFRPVEHNLVSEWDFLYNKAHNEYLNFLSTTGIVGLGTYLLFIITFIVWSLHQISNIKYQISNKSQIPNTQYPISNILVLPLFSGWFSILVTNFFGFSVVPVALFFFLIPAFCVVLSASEESNPQLLITNYSIGKAQKLSLVALLFFIFYFLFFLLKLWRADAHYAKGEKLNKSGRYDLAFAELIKAIELKKDEPVYRNEMAEAAANLALLAFQQKDATSTSKLIELAFSQSEQALKTSPGNLNFRKGQIKVFYSLSQINNNYFPLVFQSLQEAIKLAPTDPKLLYNLGIVYGAAKQPSLAIDSLTKATELKPNYRDARYTLALLYKQEGKLDEAKEQLEYILKNLIPDDTQSVQLLEEINR